MNILTRIYNRKLLTGAIAALLAVIVVGGAVAAARTVNTTARVEVTVWQSVSNGDLYLSTRPEGGRWTTHQTPLDMSRLSSSGRFRQGSAITVGVPVSVTVDVPESTVRATPTPTPRPTPTPTPRVSPTSTPVAAIELTTWSWIDDRWSDGTRYYRVHGSYHDSNLVAKPNVYLWCEGFFVWTIGLPLDSGPVGVAFRLSSQPSGEAVYRTWFSTTGTSVGGEAGGVVRPYSDQLTGFMNWLRANYAHSDTFTISIGDSYGATFNFKGLSRVYKELDCQE